MRWIPMSSHKQSPGGLAEGSVALLKLGAVHKGCRGEFSIGQKRTKTLMVHGYFLFSDYKQGTWVFFTLEHFTERINNWKVKGMLVIWWPKLGSDFYEAYLVTHRCWRLGQFCLTVCGTWGKQDFYRLGQASILEDILGDITFWQPWRQTFWSVRSGKGKVCFWARVA